MPKAHIISRDLRRFVRCCRHECAPQTNFQRLDEMNTIGLQADAHGQRPFPRRSCLKIQAHPIHRHNDQVGISLGPVSHVFPAGRRTPSHPDYWDAHGMCLRSVAGFSGLHAVPHGTR
jgi:hypothetical protein